MLLRSSGILNSLLIVSFSLFFTSCAKDFDNDGVSDKKDKCPDTPIENKVDKNGCPILEKEIGSIHFYIETSASMGGYFQKDAEFKTIISDLTTKIDNTIKPIDIWFTAESTEKYNGSTGEFSRVIATTRIANQKSSQLHSIISNIVSKSDSNDITILVSDCILSFPDADIKKNSEINRTEAPNALKSNVYSTFAALKKKGVAASIYAFNSKFYGTYYDYQNNHISLNGQHRPFYIWVIGDKEILAKFDAKLGDISTFTPAKYLHFGFIEEPVTKYDVISQIERKGSWIKDDTGIKDIELKNGEPEQFCVALNLDQLPDYAKETTYLSDNIIIDAKGCLAKVTVKSKTDIDKTKLKSQPQKELFENATNFLLIEISEMNLNEGNLQISMPLKYDTWYLDWSCMDDKTMKLAENRTFALEYLLAGVKEAYQNNNNNYIDINIQLKK